MGTEEVHRPGESDSAATLLGDDLSRVRGSGRGLLQPEHRGRELRRRFRRDLDQATRERGFRRCK